MGICFSGDSDAQIKNMENYYNEQSRIQKQGRISPKLQRRPHQPKAERISPKLERRLHQPKRNQSPQRERRPTQSKRNKSPRKSYSDLAPQACQREDLPKGKLPSEDPFKQTTPNLVYKPNISTEDSMMQNVFSAMGSALKSAAQNEYNNQIEAEFTIQNICYHN